MIPFSINEFLKFPARIFIDEAIAKELDVTSVKLRVPVKKLVTGMIRGYIEESVPEQLRRADHLGAGGGVLAVDFLDASILDVYIPPQPRTVYLLTKAQCATAVLDIEDFANRAGYLVAFNEWSED